MALMPIWRRSQAAALVAVSTAALIVLVALGLYFRSHRETPPTVFSFVAAAAVPFYVGCGLYSAFARKLPKWWTGDRQSS